MFEQIQAWHLALAACFLFSIVASFRKANRRHKEREQRLDALRKGVTIRIKK